MLKVRVGAALDGSVQATFKALPALARQAAAQVRAELNKAAGAPFETAPAAAKAALAKVTDETEKAAKKQAAIAERNAKYVAGIKTRYLLEEQRAQEKAASSAERAWKQSTSNMARSATSTYQAIRSGMSRIVGGVMRGAGIDLDIGSLVGKSVSAQSKATRISEMGYVEGEKGAAGQRQDPKGIMAAAHESANATASDTNEMLEGLQKFVGATTDLETGRKIMGDMAKLSKATGSNFGEIMEVAATLNRKFEGLPNQAEALGAAMKVVVNQGKLGGIVMSDMAKSFSTVIGSAHMIEGGPVKGAAQLGTLFQFTKMYGGVKAGSSGAAQAATSVQSFVTGMMSPAGLKNLRKMGVEGISKSGTKITDLEQFMADVMTKSGGNLEKLGAGMRNVRQSAVGRAFIKSYEEGEKTYGKGGGARMIHERFKQFSKGTSDAEMAESLKREMDTTASKVQLFQNRLEQIAGSLAERILPVLEKAAPAFLQIVESGGKLVAFFADNLGTAILAAITASIAKAAIGEGIASVLKGVLSGGGIGGGGMGAMGPIAAGAGAGIAIGAGLTTRAMVATDKTVDEAGEKQDEIQSILARARAARKAGTISKEQEVSLQLLGGHATDTTARVRNAENASNDPVRMMINRATGVLGSKDAKQAVGDHAALPQLKAVQEAQLAALRALATGVLKVEVTNPTGAGVPGVGGGTSPADRPGKK